jgi:hypothetical protein
MVDVTVVRPKDGEPRLLVERTPFNLAQYEKLRPGKPALGSIIFKRSLQHLRWYRALIGTIAEAKGLHPDQLHADLKFKAGLVQRILLNQAGQPFIQLRSVAFHGEDAMDETEFTDFRIIAVNIIFRDYLDASDKKHVWKRVEELCGPCPW